LREIKEREEDFEMKPLKAAILALLFFMAYLISLGGWWLIGGYTGSGLDQTVQVCLRKKLDITLLANPSTA